MGLCKVYPVSYCNHQVVAIDSRFVAKNVNHLHQPNIKYSQGDIFFIIFSKKHLFDADVVHHLSGITNVAYVKKFQTKYM